MRERMEADSASLSMHDHQDGNENDQDLGPRERVDRRMEQQADPACADEAQHARFAHIDVPAIDRRAEQHRHDLRHDRDPPGLQGACTGRCHGFDLAGIDLLDRFGDELGDEADGPRGDREDAGDRAGAEDGHEQQSPDHRVDRARPDQDGPSDRPGEAVGRRVARRQERHGYRQHDGDHRAEGRDVDRVDQRSDDLRQVGPAWRPHARCEVGGLLVRVAEIGPFDVEGRHRPDGGSGRARQPQPGDEHFARRMPAPDVGIAARGRRIHRIFLRAQSLNHSPKATIAAIDSRIAQAKSKS